MSGRRARTFLRRIGVRSYVDLATIDEATLTYLSDLVKDVGKLRERAIAIIKEQGRYEIRRATELPITKKRLSTGVKGLDRLLGGGVEVGAVTEIVGEYGTGKTQLCHQLAVMAKLEGVGRVLYLDADGTFRPERIVSIAEARGLGPEEALENTIYFRAVSSDQLLEAIYASRTLAPNLKIGLVIVDSVTALPQSELPGRENFYRRRRKVRDIMFGLRKLAESEMAVVVTNRVTSLLEAGEARLVPVSGFITGTFSSYRLFLRKGARGIKEVHLVFSPLHPSRRAYFRILEEGIVDATHAS